jgi:hypothetical protein
MTVGASNAKATSAVDVGRAAFSLNSPVNAFMAPSIITKSWLLLAFSMASVNGLHPLSPILIEE